MLLKIAVSRDGFIGHADKTQVPITGPIARRQAHLMRARSDAILVGAATARLDDPELTCRLPGLESRSPKRIVLSSRSHLDPDAKLARTAGASPTLVAGPRPIATSLEGTGVRWIEAKATNGGVDLAALLRCLAREESVSSLMVEGGAAVAHSFLRASLVDEIALFVGDVSLHQGVASPIAPTHVPEGFVVVRRDAFGPDTLITMRRSS